jgi:glc operon protein GlcG
MSKSSVIKGLFALLCAASLSSAAFAQMVVPTTPYGTPITLAMAKRAAGAAAAHAQKINVTMAIAVVDPAGRLVYLEKMDGTQYGSIDVAIDKARSSAEYRRPTKVFQDAVVKGGDGLRFLSLRGAVAIEGGQPLIVDGKIIGAIGLSGAAGAQDDECAKAGALAIAK